MRINLFSSSKPCFRTNDQRPSLSYLPGLRIFFFKTKPSCMSFVLLFGIVAVAQDAPPAVNIPVGESAFTVAARSAKQYKFVVPAGASAVRTGGPLHCHRRAAQQHRGLGDERRQVCEVVEESTDYQRGTQALRRQKQSMSRQSCRNMPTIPTGK